MVRRSTLHEVDVDETGKLFYWNICGERQYLSAAEEMEWRKAIAMEVRKKKRALLDGRWAEFFWELKTAVLKWMEARGRDECYGHLVVSHGGVKKEGIWHFTDVQWDSGSCNWSPLKVDAYWRGRADVSLAKQIP